MASAIEIMLNSMGLGSAIEQAKQLAEAGALQRIIQFADALDAHTAAINRLANILEGKEGGEDDGRQFQLKIVACADTAGSGLEYVTAPSLAATGTD